MTKKQEFLREQQNRDKHPESDMVGSAASVEDEQRRKTIQNVSPQDRQEPHTPKYSNDHNKMGDKSPTQTNQGQRTPESRHDRQSISAGPTNIVAASTGGKGGGRGVH